MTCCCSLCLLYKVHAIELNLQPQLHQVDLFSHYSLTELSKERLFLCSQHFKILLRQDVIHFFALNKAIHGMFFGSLVTIITNLPPATYEDSRLLRLFVSNLWHLFYCFEYNFTITVALYFHENFMVDVKLQDRKWLLAYNRVLCIYNSC